MDETFKLAAAAIVSFREMSPGPSRRPAEGRGRGHTSNQGVTVTVVLEAVQLFVSLVSTTVLESSAQASRK